jgi:hypothetical protein
MDYKDSRSTQFECVEIYPFNKYINYVIWVIRIKPEKQRHYHFIIRYQLEITGKEKFIQDLKSYRFIQSIDSKLV